MLKESEREWAEATPTVSTYTIVPTVKNTTSVQKAERKKTMATKGTQIKAGRIRQILSDGQVRTISQIANESGYSYSATNSAVEVLTNSEPLLAEEDNGALFLVIGG